VIDGTLVRRFIGIYGGRARYAPGYCALERVPPPLAFTFSGGGESPVKVTWTPPSGAPSSWRVRVSVGNSGTTCPGVGSYVNPADIESVSAGSWTDDNADQWQVSRCFRARLVNRYGGGATGPTAVLFRYVPHPTYVTAPSVVTSTNTLRFEVSPLTEGSELTALWGTPGHCPTSDDWGQPLSLDQDGSSNYYRFDAPDPSGCFVVRAYNWSTDEGSGISAPTSWSFEAPTEALQLTAFAADSWGGHSATLTGLVAPHHVSYQVIPGSCAAAAPDPDSYWEESSTGQVDDIYGAGAGLQCAVFAAGDSWGRRSALVKQEFTQSE
jgi:hypothetical protein